MTTPPPASGEPASNSGSGPRTSTFVLAFALIALLMGFSVCAILLGQVTLAVLAGTAAVALVGDVVRRILFGTQVVNDQPSVSSERAE